MALSDQKLPPNSNGTAFKKLGEAVRKIWFSYVVEKKRNAVTIVDANKTLKFRNMKEALDHLRRLISGKKEPSVAIADSGTLLPCRITVMPLRKAPENVVEAFRPIELGIIKTVPLENASNHVREILTESEKPTAVAFRVVSGQSSLIIAKVPWTKFGNPDLKIKG